MSVGELRARLAALFRALDRSCWSAPLDRAARPRILLEVFGGLGDTLLCEMLVHHLKVEDPARRVDVMTASCGELVRLMPSVDGIIEVDPETILADQRIADRNHEFWTLIRERGYGEVVEVLSMLPLSGLNSAFTGLVMMGTEAPVRVGRRGLGQLALADEAGKVTRYRIEGAPVIHTHEFDPGEPGSRSKHESLMARRTLGHDYPELRDRPRLRAPSGLHAIWAEAVADRLRGRAADRPILGVNTEVTYRLKGWPAASFHEVMRRLDVHGLRFVLVGQAPVALPSDLRHGLGDRLLDLTGRTSLSQLLAIIHHCDLFLSADTGPAHVAQAFGIPTVVLWGPSNEREFGPRDSSRHELVLADRLCGEGPCVMEPCSVRDGCMHTISVDAVVGVLTAKLERLGSDDSCWREPPDSRPVERIAYP